MPTVDPLTGLVLGVLAGLFTLTAAWQYTRPRLARWLKARQDRRLAEQIERERRAGAAERNEYGEATGVAVATWASDLRHAETVELPRYDDKPYTGAHRRRRTIAEHMSWSPPPRAALLLVRCPVGAA